VCFCFDKYRTQPSKQLNRSSFSSAGTGSGTAFTSKANSSSSVGRTGAMGSGGSSASRDHSKNENCANTVQILLSVVSAKLKKIDHLSETNFF
jgi:hypothetical protein